MDACASDIESIERGMRVAVMEEDGALDIELVDHDLKGSGLRCGVPHGEG